MSPRSIGVLLVGIIVILVISMQSAKGMRSSDYYSIQERRMPCGRILRREVVQHADAWQKTVTLMSPEGKVLAIKTRTIEPEQCQRIQAGLFVPGLWKDCAVDL